jgi:hypothetical protein
VVFNFVTVNLAGKMTAGSVPYDAIAEAEFSLATTWSERHPLALPATMDSGRFPKGYRSECSQGNSLNPESTAGVKPAADFCNDISFRPS